MELVSDRDTAQAPAAQSSGHPTPAPAAMAPELTRALAWCTAQHRNKAMNGPERAIFGATVHHIEQMFKDLRQLHYKPVLPEGAACASSPDLIQWHLDRYLDYAHTQATQQMHRLTAGQILQLEMATAAKLAENVLNDNYTPEPEPRYA